MTIKELLDKLDHERLVCAPDEWRGDYKEIVLSAMEVWNGNACKGYALAAARAAGIDESAQRAILEEMGEAFDDMTIEEAAALYEAAGE